MNEYEFRAQKRKKMPEAEWETITTNRNSSGKPYLTIGAAKGVCSREERYDRRCKEYGWGNDYQYRVQRRPVSDGWETV